jgi:hypothetical protein
MKMHLYSYVCILRKDKSKNRFFGIFFCSKKNTHFFVIKKITISLIDAIIFFWKIEDECFIKRKKILKVKINNTFFSWINKKQK